MWLAQHIRQTDSRESLNTLRIVKQEEFMFNRAELSQACTIVKVILSNNSPSVKY